MKFYINFSKLQKNVNLKTVKFSGVTDTETPRFGSVVRADDPDFENSDLESKDRMIDSLLVNVPSNNSDNGDQTLQV